MATQKYTKGTQGGNGRPFEGWNNLAKIFFNEYVDIIEEFNKNTVKVKAYNKAWKNACAELNTAKAAKNNGNKNGSQVLWKQIKSNLNTHFYPV